MEQLNLLSINNDCRTQILEYLGYRDLINIAETSKQLYTDACDTFKRTFGKGKLTLCPEYLDRSARPWFRLFEDKAPNMRPGTRIEILKLLRHFGHLVSDIFLNYEQNIAVLAYSFRHNIEQYMSEYCSKTLSNLTLIEKPKILFDNEAIQFTNLKSIDMSESHSLTISAVPFAKCFPNLHSLTWNTNSDNGLTPDSITVGFPSVRYLNISKGPCSNLCRCDAIIKLWQLNTQLTKLELHHDLDKCRIPLLPRIRDFLPKLEILKLTIYACRLYEDIIHFDNVVELKLNLFRDCKSIPFTFTKLESFIVTYYTRETQSLVSSFIANNEHLKTLHVYYARKSFRLTEMISVLSNRIENLTITDYVMPPSEVVHRLLTEIRSLKKLLLVARHYDRSSFNGLVQAKICGQEKSEDLFYVTFQPWNR